MNLKCKKCQQLFEYSEAECWWDFKGMDYDAKLVKHKECGCINVVQYVEMPDRDEWLMKKENKRAVEYHDNYEYEEDD